MPPPKYRGRAKAKPSDGTSSIFEGIDDLVVRRSSPHKSASSSVPVGTSTRSKAESPVQDVSGQKKRHRGAVPEKPKCDTVECLGRNLVPCPSVLLSLRSLPSSPEEAWEELRALPEYTRHMDTYATSKDASQCLMSLAHDVRTIVGCLKRSIRYSSPTSIALDSDNEPHSVISYDVLTVAWNRLRRVRQVLASIRHQIHSGSQLNSATPISMPQSAIAEEDGLADFFTKLVWDTKQTIVGNSAKGRGGDGDVSLFELHEALSISSSAVSVCVALALQDWEGVVSVVAPIGAETLVKRAKRRDEGMRTYVASHSGVYVGVGVSRDRDCSSREREEVKAEAQQVGRDVNGGFVCDSSLLLGAKILVGAFSYEASFSDDELPQSSLSSSLSSPLPSFAEEVGVSRADRQKALDDSDNPLPNQVFVALAHYLSADLWGDDLLGIRTKLTAALREVESPDFEGVEKTSDQLSLPESGAGYFLAMLLRLGLFSCRWRQQEVSGMNSRMAASFRPVPTLESTTSSTSVSSCPEPKIVWLSGRSLKQTIPNCPKRFWGVPKELERFFSLYDE